jgi:hypothetical protein
LVCYLRLRDTTEMNGLETYVRECIDARNTEWFPMGHAMCLDQTDEGNPEVAALGKRIDAFNGVLIAEIVKLRAAVAALEPPGRV